jgi:aspartyl-tRNA synthetase
MPEEKPEIDFHRTRLSTAPFESKEGEQEALMTGWVHDIRNLGGIAFILIRDSGGMFQATAIKKVLGKETYKAVVDIPRESVLAVKGKLQPNEEVMNGYELLISDFLVLNESAVPLPLGVADKVGAELDTRLDNRFLDLRKEEVRSIFLIQSAALHAAREQFESEGFVEIHTPKIVATATEGGTALFAMEYFERAAYLNQSPQLFKQIMMASSLEKIYEIGPAFRAEEHDTVRHLNEYTSMDIEMAFANEEDVMQVLERVVHRAYEYVAQECRKELEILNVQLEIPKLPFPRITYDKVVEVIKSEGVAMEWGEDFSMEAMKVYCEHEPGLYFITEWPSAMKPFYALPFEDRPEKCRAFDLMFGKEEITSGAQRVHMHDLLRSRIEAQGLSPEPFEFYLKTFKYGMPPHGGWGLGLERLTMMLTGKGNIRETVLFPRDRQRLIP